MYRCDKRRVGVNGKTRSSDGAGVTSEGMVSVDLGMECVAMDVN